VDYFTTLSTPRMCSAKPKDDWWTTEWGDSGKNQSRDIEEKYKISGQLVPKPRFEPRASQIDATSFGSEFTVVCSRRHKWLSSFKLLKNNSNQLTVNELRTLRGFELVFQLMSSISWDIMPCSPLKFSRRFRGTFRLHLQARRIRQASR
jgi:hypothetical protein